jgi:hypothetical protein
MRRKYNVCWHIQKDRARSWESAIIPQEPGRSIRKHPTGRAYADAALEMIDRLTRGHADWFQRAFSYLLIGGFSVVVNLIVFSLVYYRVSWPAEQQWHYAAASEVSILANFFPTDVGSLVPLH